MPKYPEYDSPIYIHEQEGIKFTREINEAIDEECYKAILRVGVDVDRDTLLKALQQDSERYREAYRKGYETAKAEANERIQRLMDNLKAVCSEEDE